jgi:hypothetical protein
MDETSSGLAKLAIDFSSSHLSFPEAFVWDWYIRLKVHFPAHTGVDISANLDVVSKEFNVLWQGNVSKRSSLENPLTQNRTKRHT